MTPYELAVDTFHADCKQAGTSQRKISAVRSKTHDHSIARDVRVMIHLKGFKGPTLAIYAVSGPQPGDRLGIGRVYRREEPGALKPVIEEARELWIKRAEEFQKSGESDGSAVLGAGIASLTLFDEERRPRMREIISAPLTMQGSLSWESSLPEVLEYLYRHGVYGYYIEGRLD
jgi:hypothetical protein